MSVRSLARVARNSLLYRAMKLGDKKLPGGAAGILYRDRFIEDSAGAEYGVTQKAKRELAEKFDRINAEVTTATNTSVQLALTQEILSIPRNVNGDVVECGCYRGASSAALSLACALVGRRLIVCDSFEGLPDDDAPVHMSIHTGRYGHYKRGMFAGALDEVQANIKAHGDISICHFIKGYFNESLKALNKPIVFAFLDVDLESSTRDALKYVWPLLVDGGAVFTDDASDLDCVRPFFDDDWWVKEFGHKAPGFIGSGCGVLNIPPYSSVGYARKMVCFDKAKFARSPWLYYPD